MVLPATQADLYMYGVLSVLLAVSYVYRTQLIVLNTINHA
jgi:hypothetical protein